MPRKSTVRARFTKGVFKPLRRIALPENEEVTLEIVRVPTDKDIRLAITAAGGWKGLNDREQLIRDIYAHRLIKTRPEPRL